MRNKTNTIKLKKILFIDRDGTLIQEPEKTFQVNSLEELVFLPKVIWSLVKFIESWYELVIVTNQDWLWTKSNPRNNYERINEKMFEVFAWESVEFKEIFECPHFESDNCNCRKPKILILWDFLDREAIDFKNSYMIWDRESDEQFAQNIWVKFEKVVFWSNEDNWEKITKKILKI